MRGESSLRNVQTRCPRTTKAGGVALQPERNVAPAARDTVAPEECNVAPVDTADVAPVAATHSQVTAMLHRRVAPMLHPRVPPPRRTRCTPKVARCPRRCTPVRRATQRPRPSRCTGNATTQRPPGHTGCLDGIRERTRVPLSAAQTHKLTSIQVDPPESTTEPTASARCPGIDSWRCLGRHSLTSGFDAGPGPGLRAYTRARR